MVRPACGELAHSGGKEEFMIPSYVAMVMTSVIADSAKMEECLEDIYRNAFTNSFWVARVSSAVFSRDQDVSLKVSTIYWTKNGELNTYTARV